MWTQLQRDVQEAALPLLPPDLTVTSQTLPLLDTQQDRGLQAGQGCCQATVRVCRAWNRQPGTDRSTPGPLFLLPDTPRRSPGPRSDNKGSDLLLRAVLS
jgi:hypothetical protein